MRSILIPPGRQTGGDALHYWQNAIADDSLNADNLMASDALVISFQALSPSLSPHLHAHVNGQLNSAHTTSSREGHSRCEHLRVDYIPGRQLGDTSQTESGSTPGSTHPSQDE